MISGVLADGVTDLQRVGIVAQAFVSILTGLIAALGVPLALRQVVNLQREMRRYEMETRRRLDAETNLNISARHSLTRPAHHNGTHGSAHGMPTTQSGAAVAERLDPVASAQPSPAAEPGKRVLRLDLTLENVGEGSVDVLACLVAARELERHGEGVISGGRDAQWDDLTAHFWDADPARSLSPGLSTTKHIVYAQDALARIKAKSHKVLARVDQVRERLEGEGDDIYLLYRIVVVARRSARASEAVAQWSALQRALLNVNAPAFRAAASERDPLGYATTPDGWHLFLHHHDALADPKLPKLRAAADREELALSDAAERRQAAERHAAELRAYCEASLTPAWRAFRADYDRMLSDPGGFASLLADRRFRHRQREIERRFPWSAQEVWTEYVYVTLQDEE
jgi:hypothetical protein